MPDTKKRESITTVQMTLAEKKQLSETAKKYATRIGMSSMSPRELINIMHSRFKQHEEL